MKPPPFASLVAGWSHGEEGPLGAAIAARRAAALPLVDLITANPHAHGLEFPGDRLAAITAAAHHVMGPYSPDPRGQFAARDAITRWYRRRGHPCKPGDVVLTPGTSLAYFYAFRLLCDPGAEVLVPRPGYPLFDDIAALCGVRLRAYHLSETPAGWTLDPDEVAFQVTPSTRAIVVVSPHNPTGLVCPPQTLSALGRTCRQHALAMLFDEVFCEFTGSSLPRPDPDGLPLLVLLNGFSKMFSLPGHKAGWMVVQGTSAPRLLPALEHVSDTFLPVSELVQAMIPGVLEAGDPAVSETLGREYAARRRFACQRAPLPTHDPGAGVYVCMRLPAGVDDNEFALRCVREAGVLVHPGYFYDMPGHLVMTCVARPEVLEEGLSLVAGILT